MEPLDPTHAGVMTLGDDELVKRMLADLGPLLGLRGEPELVNIIRHARAIAQYVPGHLARLAAIDAAAARHGSLWFAGSAYRGIAVNACVKESEAVADKILAALTGARPLSAEVAR